MIIAPNIKKIFFVFVYVYLFIMKMRCDMEAYFLPVQQNNRFEDYKYILIHSEIEWLKILK